MRIEELLLPLSVESSNDGRIDELGEGCWVKSDETLSASLLGAERDFAERYRLLQC